jgi:predicted ester cyclase
MADTDPKPLVPLLLRGGPDAAPDRQTGQTARTRFRSHAPSGATIDRNQYRSAVDATLAAFPDLAVTIEEQVAEGDLVATRWTAEGTHSGALFGLEATRRTVRVSAMHIHRVRNGRFVEHWEVIDLHGLLAQLTREDG